MMLQDVIRIISGSVGILLVVEFLYSFLRRDSVYSLFGVGGNIIGYQMIVLFIKPITIEYQAFFSSNFLYHNGIPNSVVAFFLCLAFSDIIYYVIHRAHHRVPVLWALHSVHHSDSKFNMGVAIRLSWIQYLYAPLLTYIPMVLVGFRPELVALALLVESIYQSLSHSAYIRFPRILRYILITPDNHKIHHDDALLSQKSNFGGILSIWDRLFGTYVENIESFSPGIEGYHQDNFFLMQTDPIVSLLKNK